MLRQDRAVDADERVATFFRAVERRLEEREAALSPAGLSRRFSEERLFGDDDGHGFRPTRHFY